MRFRADAMQNITDAPKRSILLFSSSAGLNLMVELQQQKIAEQGAQLAELKALLAEKTI